MLVFQRSFRHDEIVQRAREPGLAATQASSMVTLHS